MSTFSVLKLITLSLVGLACNETPRSQWQGGHWTNSVMGTTKSLSLAGIGVVSDDSGGVRGEGEGGGGARRAGEGRTNSAI